MRLSTMGRSSLVLCWRKFTTMAETDKFPESGGYLLSSLARFVIAGCATAALEHLRRKAIQANRDDVYDERDSAETKLEIINVELRVLKRELAEHPAEPGE